MIYTVDRIEENFAVCETRNGMVNVPLSELPDNIGVGSVFSIDKGKYIFRDDEEIAAKLANISLLQKLKNKNKK
jgi:hypothetical protein